MTVFAQATIVLAAAAVLVLLFKRAGLGVVLGYLAAGVVVGPAGLHVVEHVDELMHIAELGVVFFLFLVGLELSPERLWALRRAVFGLGNAQMLATAAVLALGAAIAGVPAAAAVVVGLGLALSSTAIALRLLSDRGLSHSASGEAGFAILLFQDIAVVPLLALLPLLGGDASDTSVGGVVVGGVKVVGVVAVFLVGGRYAVRPLFGALARAGVHEISVVVALLLVVGAGLAMTAVGMSMGLGAFLAGVLLANSEYRHELEANIDPFKGILLGLFFMSIGMSANLQLLVADPAQVVGAIAVVVVVKAVVLFGVLRLVPEAARDERARVAVALSQGGEFAFVLFGVAASAGVMTAELKELLVVVVSLSMATTPIALPLIERLLRRLAPAAAAPRPYDDNVEEAPIIICGYGRVGQIVSRALAVAGFTYTALEIDAEHVDFVRRYGNKLFYGDASRLDLLRSAGIERARAVIVAIDDVEANVRAVEVIRGSFPHVPVYARARNRAHVYRLLDLGVRALERETFHSSMRLAGHVLGDLGLSEAEVNDTLTRFEKLDADLLARQHTVSQDEGQLIQTAQQAGAELRRLLDEEAARRKELAGNAATASEALAEAAASTSTPT
jgi:monovalent cation:proton antiporter-2 (CPA2) family protein